MSLRIQVLALTPEIVGEATSTPFVLVIDGADAEVLTQQYLAWIKEATGARAVICSPDPIALVDQVTLTDEQAVQLLARIDQAAT